MSDIPTAVLYLSLFVSLFFEVFLLITYFEVREEIKLEHKMGGKQPTRFPSVTIIVPCFNEETTVDGTVISLLGLNYPKDKLQLILVDDGSTDSTATVLEKYRTNPQIKVFIKENGGKHDALNYALKHVDTELVGCLDADSFVDPEALRRIVPYFDDASIMAVTPSVKVHEPKNILQLAQRVEYSWGIFLRKMLSHLDALYVTPGPFSIFRSEVFRKIGGYRHAHQTEDMEMALRMQKNKYKIANSLSAYVYTVTPSKIKPLYKQRRRWTYGFLNNAVDYRDLYFNKKYGNIGLFILPIATLSIFTTIFAGITFLIKSMSKAVNTYGHYQAVDWSFHWPNFKLDWFFVNTGAVAVLGFIAFALSLGVLMLAMRISHGKKDWFKPELFYYLPIYMVIVPFWYASALFNTVFARKVTWR